jgi:hypothetical protein
MSGGRAIFIVGFVCLALPSAAATLPTVDVAELERCAAIAGRDERLTCYDQALAALVQARAALSQPLSNPSQPSAAMTQRAPSAPQPPSPAGNSFGLPTPQPVTPERPEQIKALVDKVTEDRLGNVSVVLDNGQAWVFVEPGASLRPGEVVTIKRAALGSYLLTTRVKRSYHVHRQQ